MDLKQLTEKSAAFIKKYKFVVLILLIGLVLMLLPESKKEQITVKESDTAVLKSEITFEEKLAAILAKISGAGQVEVMLTVAEGEEILFQTDDSISGSGETGSRNTDTVTVTDAQKNQNGLIRKVNPPSYRGAIIVCQGADNPAVKLAVTEAVSKITGIGANCISVLKMK